MSIIRFDIGLHWPSIDDYFAISWLHTIPNTAHNNFYLRDSMWLHSITQINNWLLGHDGWPTRDPICTIGQLWAQFWGLKLLEPENKYIGWIYRSLSLLSNAP